MSWGAQEPWEGERPPRVAELGSCPAAPLGEPRLLLLEVPAA